VKRFRTGVTVGKFWPPHRGHHHLIQTASAQCDRFTVIVAVHPDQDLPGEIRAACLREVHPEVEVIAVPDDVPDDIGLWAENTCRILGARPEAVFTSEDYGEPWAAAMGAIHVSVDRARRTFPCSGRAIRADPLGHLEYLSPFMRAVYVRRVCVLGAASTGTTTLAQALAAHYGTVWVPEYGREYSLQKRRSGQAGKWETAEFTAIAREQARREDEAAREANRVLVCDTDVFATTLWHERYVGGRSPEVDALAAGRRADLYLLTGDEIPFVPDGLRDSEHVRHRMHERFVEELGITGREWRLLTGTPERRLAEAVRQVDARLRAPVRPRTSTSPTAPRIP
jgi:HTH-type transcriptional regulator, transcriptional repressor of NAD biosynthesis genes